MAAPARRALRCLWSSILLKLLAVLAALTTSAEGAGGGIWILGPQVETQPKLIFMLFVIVVLFTMVLEFLKHKAEHATHGTHRGEALNAIFSELMMIGIISFFMILAGEFGVSGMRFETPCVDDLMPAPNQTDTVATVRRHSSTLGYLAQPRHRFTEIQPPRRVPLPTDAPITNFGDMPASISDDPKPGDVMSFTDTTDNGGSPTHHRRGASALGGVTNADAGEQKCYIGVTMLLLEYAHLVLFVMGICYGTFIQVAFYRRNHYVQEIETIQAKKTLGSCGRWAEPSVWCVTGLGSTQGWQRTVLTMRNAVVLHCRERLRGVCTVEEYEIEVALADIQGLPRPVTRAGPKGFESQFDFGRFVHKAQAETLVELVHIPPIVWLGIVAMSAVNLVYFYGISLPRTLLFFSFLMPLMAVGLVVRMGLQLRGIIRGAIGHPLIDTVNFQQKPPEPGEPYFCVVGPAGAAGREWAAGEMTPWDSLTGCCEDGSTLDFLDVNDSGSLKVQIQMIVFSSCFFLGQLCMLAVMVIDELGPGGFVGILLISLFPLVVIIPRAILLYTLTHRTFDPPRAWLQAAISTGDEDARSTHEPVSRLRSYLTKLKDPQSLRQTGNGHSQDAAATGSSADNTHTKMPPWSPAIARGVHSAHNKGVSFVDPMRSSFQAPTASPTTPAVPAEMSRTASGGTGLTHPASVYSQQPLTPPAPGSMNYGSGFVRAGRRVGSLDDTQEISLSNSQSISFPDRRNTSTAWARNSRPCGAGADFGPSRSSQVLASPGNPLSVGLQPTKPPGMSAPHRAPSRAAPRAYSRGPYNSNYTELAHADDLPDNGEIVLTQ